MRSTLCQSRIVPPPCLFRRMNLESLAPFEDRLLHALAFFRTGRDVERQALHCLSMYLRQSESRVMAEVAFYARQLGMSAEAMLEAIYTDPQAIADRLGDRFPDQPSPLLQLDEDE